jgi:hypothetical protein
MTMTLATIVLYLASLITQGTPTGATDTGRRCLDTRLGGYAWVTVIDFGTLHEDEVPVEEYGALLDFFVHDGRSFLAYIDTGDICRPPNGQAWEGR